MRSQQPLAEGIVEEALPQAQFKIKLAAGRTIRAHLSGRMRMHKIHVLPGDRVKLIVSGDIGRIERRL